MTSTAVAAYQPSPPETAPRSRQGVADALPVFASESDADDGLDRATAAAHLAEVVLHRRAGTPLVLGLFGPAGSGKTRFFRALLDATASLTAAARATSHSPFLDRVAVARIAATPGREPVAMLVGGVIEALAKDHAAATETAVHAGGDPREAARLAGERVNALRRALDGERQALDDIGARRARLSETVLFGGADSRMDAFARSNRGRIEARLRAFGLTASDPIRAYKELVRDGVETNGTGSRPRLTLRAFWGFKGQGLLLLLAALLAALGWAAKAGADDPAPVSDWLSGFGDRTGGVAEAIRAHLDLLGPIGHIALALAALALLADVVRALRFLGPVYRGIALFKGDLAARRRDLDGLLAHQTRRVDGLAAEAEAAGRGADAAQRRADERRSGGLSDHGAALAGELFGLARTPDMAADGFFAKLGADMAEGSDGLPDRIVVALDGLDRLPPAEMAACLSAAGSLLGRPGFALVVTLERDLVAAALGEADPAAAAARLDRIVHLSYDLGATPVDAPALAGRLLDPRVAQEPPPVPVDAARSALDRSYEPFEADLVQRLAPFAGGTPRGVKRFVNAYRVARADPRLARPAPASLAMLALALALDGTGAGSEVAGFDADVARGQVTVDPRSDFGRAFAVAISAVGSEGAGTDLRRGLAVARSYGRRG